MFMFGIAFFITALFQPTGNELSSRKDGVGIIELKGVILSAEEILDSLVKFKNAPNVKAIVLRIDSPGGTVGAAQEIYEEVRRTNAIKPVVASMGSVAASGGYYVSLGATRILASPGTLTGSMGVILKFANLEDLFEKIGYKVEVVKSGKLKDIGSASRALTQEERKVLQDVLDNVHEQFINAISESRKLPADKIRIMADGRVFSGAQAKELGLIDDFGNLMDAARLAGKLAGFDEADPTLIYPAEKGFSLLRLLSGTRTQSNLGIPGLQNPGIAYEWSLTN